MHEAGIPPHVADKDLKPVLLLSWKQILFIIGLLMLYHILLVTYALGMLIGAHQTQTEIGAFIDLISSNSDGTILTVLLLISGILCLGHSSFAVFLLIKSIKIEGSPKTNKLLYTQIWGTFILIGALVVLGVLVVWHSYGMHEGLSDGILYAMKLYGTDVGKKMMIDRMQIRFQCCGSSGYKDWFQIEWYDPLVGGPTHSNQNTTDIVSDSTPYSCCLIGVLFPCIHQHLLNRTDIFTKPKERDLTISSDGCHPIIKDETIYIGWLITLTILGMVLLQLPGIIGMRIIQTSHSGRNRFIRTNNYFHTGWIYEKKTKK